MNSNRYNLEEHGTDGCCEKNRLSIFLGVLLAIALLVLGLTFTGYLKILPALKTNECSTTECIKASSELISLIDDSVDPCEDFYSFVCGKFIKKAYEYQVNSLLKVEHEKIQNQIDSFIIDKVSEDDPQPVQMQKKFFLSCLNEHDLDNDQDRTFFSLIDQLGGWPLLNRRQWREKEFDWMRVMIHARQLGMPYEWFLKVDLHKNDTSKKHNFKLTRPDGCNLPHNHPTEDYVNMMSSILSILSEVGLHPISEIQSIINFEKEFAVACARSKSSNVTVNTLIELESIWFKNGIDLLKFLRALTGQSAKWQLNSKIGYDDFIFRLDNLLRRTSPKVQAGFIVWKMIESFAPYLSRPVRETYKNYTEKITGKSMNRFQICLEDSRSKFQYVSETMLIRYYAESIKEEEESFVKIVTEEVTNQLEEMKWSDNETKLMYQNLESVLGGADSIFEDNIFTDFLYVGDLSFSSPNVIKMITQLSISLFESKIQNIGKEISNLDLESTYEANSRHMIVFDEEKLFVPAAMFRGFLYNPDQPQYLNYGGLGTAIALALARRLPILAEMFNETYSTPTENRKCLSESLQEEDKDINAVAILKANYASLLAQDIAYKSYESWLEKNEEEQNMIGLNYAPKQLFWIKSSLPWCYRSLPEDEDTLPDLDKILKFRIIEGVKNSEAFAEDFGCPTGSNMNPETKCWLL